MGEVIRFRPREGVRRQNSADERGEIGAGYTAQILLFTGVRYERYGEAEAHFAKPHKKRGRPRKRA